MKNKARLSNKIYRKIHWLMYRRFNSNNRLNLIYPAYRHRNHKNDSDDVSTLYITQIPNEGAGIGHQISNFNDGLFASMVFGIKFAYPGFRGKEDWEHFLGFDQDFESVKSLKKKGYKLLTLPYFKFDEDAAFTDEKGNRDYSGCINKKSVLLIKDIIKSYAGKKVVFNVNLDQMLTNQYEVIPLIKPRFESAVARKEDKLIYEKDVKNIAVHIRRGDINKGQVTGDETLTKRWLDMNYYENIVATLTGNISGKYHIYIFSEGNAEEYKTFEKYGPVTYCFDMSAMDSFLHMIRADILVLSKSSFSYKPALLSDGIRICPPDFWHGFPDDPKWIVADREGNITDGKIT